MIDTKTQQRVPLHALQMLTQSVSPRDYVHTYAPAISESTDQQKKSPLALLAATCSSIGKTEGKKESREPAINTTRHSPKINSDVRSAVKFGSDENKSSFKPYKQLEEKDSSEKPGFRAPSKENDVVPSSSHSKSPEPYRSKISHIGSGFSPFQYPYLTDGSGGHCFYQTSPASRLCGMYYDQGTPSSGHHSTCLKTDCSGNCTPMILPSSTSTTPGIPSIRPMFPTPPVSAPSPVKSHGLSSTTARSNSLYPRCNCGYCNQATSGQDNGLKAHLPHYHRDYLQATACQDPYCTNCKSSSANRSIGAGRAGCGPHCFHHHHDSPIIPGSLPTVPSSMSHLYPYTGFMLRAQNDQTGPFVCNWVQDSKNCGKNFTTSEELLQHLRTHTSAANATAPLHTPCNIPGCPCGLKSPIAGPRLHSTARYHPYFMPSPALHSPTYHSAIAHYSTPHGIPYPSSIKPY